MESSSSPIDPIIQPIGTPAPERTVPKFRGARRTGINLPKPASFYDASLLDRNPVKAQKGFELGATRGTAWYFAKHRKMRPECRTWKVEVQDPADVGTPRPCLAESPCFGAHADPPAPEAFSSLGVL